MLIMSKAAHHGRVTPTSVESRFCVVKFASSSPRAQIVDFRYQTKPESLTKMALRLVQFLAIMLTAAFGSALASFLLIAANLTRLCYPRGRVIAIDLEAGDAQNPALRECRS